MSFPTLRLLFVLLSLTPLVACGGSSFNPPPPSPIFTSTPPTTAAEGTLYSYTPQATDPAGGTVSFTLSARPAGASFSAGSLAWTPTLEESRVPDQFTITATSSEGGTARQSWNVVPTGTVHGTWIDTYWTPDGRVDVPINWATFGLTPQALIPQSDGTVITHDAAVNSDGTFSIADVPGGYYWFRFASNSFWTSSSQIDFGADISGSRLATVPMQQTTTFDFAVDGLDPVQTNDQFAFLTDLANPFNIGFPIPSAPGSTAMNMSYSTNTNLDFSAAHTGFLLQYEPVAADSLTGIALGPELTIENLAIANGSVNDLPGTLHSSARVSFDLSVKGSEWTAAFQNIAPGTALPVDAYINVFTQPYIDANVLASTARFDLNIPLFLPDLRSTSSGFLLSWPGAGSCVDTVQFTTLQIAAHPAILSDLDFGTLTYQDPFPGEWKRVFSLCQTATFNMPIPGSGATAPVLFGTGQNTTIPTSPVSPLILPVSNPKLNGASLFTAATISPIGLTLSWTRPTGLTPYAYKIALFTLRPQGDGTFNYFPAGTFTTGKTTATLPPLQSGQTYVFAISARIDGKADVEKSPNRSALPTAYATVISAPITMD